jgi:pimeloyl-ACP methyl ester carboxylesterase
MRDDERARPLKYLDIGAGPTIMLLHGYGMKPATYLPMARLLADRARIVIPDMFALPERGPSSTRSTASSSHSTTSASSR